MPPFVLPHHSPLSLPRLVGSHRKVAGRQDRPILRQRLDIVAPAGGKHGARRIAARHVVLRVGLIVRRRAGREGHVVRDECGGVGGAEGDGEGEHDRGRVRGGGLGRLVKTLVELQWDARRGEKLVQAAHAWGSAAGSRFLERAELTVQVMVWLPFTVHPVVSVGWVKVNACTAADRVAAAITRNPNIAVRVVAC